METKVEDLLSIFMAGNLAGDVCRGSRGAFNTAEQRLVLCGITKKMSIRGENN